MFLIRGTGASLSSPLHWLLVQGICTICSGATVIAVKYTSQLRPRSQDYVERAFLESRAQSELNSITCGDADGHPVDIPSLVQSAAEAGLPSASSSGVVFIQATVVDSDGCGPYTCLVSQDATGQTWSRMTVIQDVPDVNEGCALPGSNSTYTVVAKLPSDTLCSGVDGSCLVMCKTLEASIGSCAAIRLAGLPRTETSQPAERKSTSSSNPTSSTSKQVDSKTLLPSPITSSVIQPGSTHVLSAQPTSTQARAGLQGFSGENGPGGPAEQHLSFGTLEASEETNERVDRIAAAVNHSPHGLLVFGLLASTVVLLARI